MKREVTSESGVLVRRSLRSRLLAAVSAAVAVPLLATPGTALAEVPAPTGGTVVGRLVQAWPEHLDHPDAATTGGHGLHSWIEPEEGDTVRPR
jgi:hypothetical protein